jgi:hypothetical protein
MRPKQHETRGSRDLHLVPTHPIISSLGTIGTPATLKLEAWPSDCALRLAEIARFANEPTLNGPGQCGASDVVRLEGIMMPNSALVTVMPAATLMQHWATG